jgi:hypothetical protein
MWYDGEDNDRLRSSWNEKLALKSFGLSLVRTIRTWMIWFYVEVAQSLICSVPSRVRIYISIDHPFFFQISSLPRWSRQRNVGNPSSKLRSPIGPCLSFWWQRSYCERASFSPRYGFQRCRSASLPILWTGGIVVTWRVLTVSGEMKLSLSCALQVLGDKSYEELEVCTYYL